MNAPLVGVEEWSAKRMESQLLGFAYDERPAGQRGRCPAGFASVARPLPFKAFPHADPTRGEKIG